jgi:hypothetical protein
MKEQPITIHRPTYVLDEYGNETGEISGYVDIPTTGRVRPTSAREVTTGQQRSLVDAVGVLPPDADLEDTDELSAGGRRYRVLGHFLVEAMIPRLRHLRIDLQAVS